MCAIKILGSLPSVQFDDDDGEVSSESWQSFSRIFQVDSTPKFFTIPFFWGHPDACVIFQRPHSGKKVYYCNFYFCILNLEPPYNLRHCAVLYTNWKSKSVIPFADSTGAYSLYKCPVNVKRKYFIVVDYYLWWSKFLYRYSIWNVSIAGVAKVTD